MEDVGEECFEKELPRVQPFDDAFGCPAARARPRRPWCGRCERFGRRRRGDREGLTTLGELACPTARGEETQVADADKALRQDVQENAELASRSVLIEHPLDFFKIVNLRERQHQKNPRLLGIQRVCRNHPHLVVLLLRNHAAVASPVRPHEDRPCIEGQTEERRQLCWLTSAFSAAAATALPPTAANAGQPAGRRRHRRRARRQAPPHAFSKTTRPSRQSREAAQIQTRRRHTVSVLYRQ
jgi:hypothetical protein